MKSLTRALLTSTVLSGAWTINALAMAQVDAVEEQASEGEDLVQDVITVTGSFIARDSFEDVGSPVSIVDSDDILKAGPATKPTDFLRQVPQNQGNNGTAVNTPGTSGDANFTPAVFGGGFVDLRGLGGGATLALVNGQRRARYALSSDGLVDVNTLAPTIALERVEILRDGASGLYGTDAISGVVNFITRDDYEGVEVRAGISQGTDLTETGRRYVGALFGSEAGDRGHFTVAFEYSDNDGANVGDFGLIEESLERYGTLTNRSGFGQPGNFIVPTRDANGQLTGSTSFTPDPLLSDVVDAGFTFNDSSIGSDTIVDPINGFARLTFKTQELISSYESFNARSSVTYDVTDDIELYGSAALVNTQSIRTYQKTTPPLDVPYFAAGDHPNNPFRAVDAAGNELFALDANNDGVADLDVDGNAILSANPTDPSSGVAFNDRVQVFIRPYSTTNTAPAALPQESWSFNANAGFKGSFNEDWAWDVNGVISRQQLNWRITDVNGGAFQTALDGNGGALGNLYFNPFASSYFASEGQSGFNDPSLENDIALVVQNVYTSELKSLDGIVTGSFGSLPGGPIGVAVGAQVREESLTHNLDSAVTARVASFSGFGDPSFDASDTTLALFAETNLPLMDNEFGTFDLSAAVRYEHLDGLDLSSTNPKVSALYRNNWLSLRASYATAFLAPSLAQRFGTTTVQTVALDDPVTGLTNLQIATRVVGSGTLDPQESDSYNIGVTIEPIEGLSFAVDYWDFEYEKLLTTVTAQSVINSDPNGPGITRDSATNQITLIETPFFNAGALNTSGLDLQASYELGDLGIGDVLLFANGTLVTEYEYQETLADPLVDGLGFGNNTGFGIPIAEVKGNYGVEWTSGSHFVGLTGRHVSEVVIRGGDGAEAQDLFDAQYSYSLDSVGKGATLTLGASNVFDNRPNLVRGPGGFAYYLNSQIIEPRTVYARVTASF